MTPLRNEINTRFKFAKERGEFWYARIKGSEKSGNVVSCLAARKYRQAGRIYNHYQKEFTKFINNK